MGMKAITLALAFVFINLGMSWFTQMDILGMGGTYNNSIVSWANGINGTAGTPNDNYLSQLLSSIPIVNAIPQAQTMFSMLGGLVHALSFDWIRDLLPMSLQHYFVVDSIILGMNGIFALLVMFTIIDLLRFAIGRTV
jgi:hypothetical protein